MISLESSHISASNGIQNSSSMMGLDLMTSLQILLVQDYDQQLRGIEKNMRSALEIKKRYREDMEPLQKMMSKATHKSDNRFYLQLETPEEINAFRKDSEYMQQTELTSDAGEGSWIVEHNTPLSDEDFHAQLRDKKGGKYDLGEEMYVEKSQIEAKIEVINQKLERVNEQSEITSLALQSLTNQRKIAFETVSNLMRKNHDTIAMIVNNLK